MKIQHWLSYGAIVLALCLTSTYTSLGQDSKPKTLPLPEIVKRIQPSTVVVLIYDENGKAKSQGSGFFVSKTGHIITNRHVLEGASRAEIKTAQGRIYPITHIVAEDKEGDLVQALVDIKAESVQPLKLSNSVPLVGERIVVIGNPLGLEGTVSDGIVSAVRDIPAFGKIIQLSAPISPGSSGSPVVDMKGQVIGIATFQMAEGQNLNFAIPSQRAVKLQPSNLKSSKPKTLSEWQTPAIDERLTLAEALYLRGLLYLWREEYENAFSFFEKATKKNSEYAEAWFYVGYCQGRFDRYTEEITAYKQAIRIKPDFAEAYNNLGIAYDGLGHYAEAIAAFKQAIRIKPGYAEAHYNLGVAYARDLGQYPDAIDALKQAIRIKPDYAEAYNNLGIAYDGLGHYAEAVAAYKQAIRIKPDLAETHTSLGNTYMHLGRYAEAIAAHKQAIRIKPDCAEAHNNLGVIYDKLGHYVEAVAAYKQAIRVKPDYATAHYLLGLAYCVVVDRGSALDQYKILKDLDRDLANKLFTLIYQ